jgi:hypothetical protein
VYHMAHNHGTELIKNNNWHKARIGGYSCRSRAIPPYSRCVTPSASGEISRPRGPPKAAPSPPSEERAMNGGGRSADLTADDPAAYHTDLRERRDLRGSDGVQAPHTHFYRYRPLERLSAILAGISRLLSSAWRAARHAASNRASNSDTTLFPSAAAILSAACDTPSGTQERRSIACVTRSLRCSQVFLEVLAPPL